jgi:hypothetical protein
MTTPRDHVVRWDEWDYALKRWRTCARHVAAAQVDAECQAAQARGGRRIRVQYPTPKGEQ